MDSEPRTSDADGFGARLVRRSRPQVVVARRIGARRTIGRVAPKALFTSCVTPRASVARTCFFSASSMPVSNEVVRRRLLITIDACGRKRLKSSRLPACAYR